jgi:ATP-binding cassette, subfamily B, bacterial
VTHPTQTLTRLIRRARQLGSDLAATIALAWSAGPGLMLLAITLDAILALLPIANLWVGKLLLDAVTAAIAAGGQASEQSYEQLALLLGTQVGLVALSAAVGAATQAVHDLVADTIQHRVSQRILEKAATLEVAHFEDAATYDMLRNAAGDGAPRRFAAALQLVSMFQALVSLIGAASLMATLGPRVLPLAMIAAIPGVIAAARTGADNYRMIRHHAAVSRQQSYTAAVLTADALVKEVRLFGFEHYLLARWRTHYAGFRRQLVRLNQRRIAWNSMAAVASAALIGLATLPVLRQVSQGDMTVGDFSMFALGVAHVQQQFAALLRGATNVYEDLLYTRNVFEFLDLPARDLDAGEEWHGPIERVEFDHVSFRYPLTARDTLTDVCFTIERGQALALVGPNGAGKTTIVKLMTRLFEPSSGRVLLNGVDARRFSPRSVQRELSVIFQDFGRYHMTVRENIAIGRIERLDDDGALIDATRAAGAADFAAALPRGFDTMLGRQFAGGQELSGGQWQRMALARLYFRRASVRIFDEPTSALDAAAEAETIERFCRDRNQQITVLISHRLSTVRLADWIVVLERGATIEAGTHELLVAKGGVYASLYALQARGYYPTAGPQPQPYASSAN